MWFMLSNAGAVNSGHSGFCSPFGFQGYHRQTQFRCQDDFQTPNPTYTLVVSMWTLASYKVSARCKRCHFCFYLTITLQAHFSVPLKPLVKREYPRNVWFTFKILVRSEFEFSFAIQPLDVRGHYLRGS